MNHKCLLSSINMLAVQNSIKYILYDYIAPVTVKYYLHHLQKVLLMSLGGFLYIHIRPWYQFYL